MTDDDRADDKASARSARTEAPLRQLHPLPRGLVELYGLLAVLFVLVPEWMAGGAWLGFREGRAGSNLPVPAQAWRRLPELRLASMHVRELRQLAQRLGISGYGRHNRDQLTKVLLRRLPASGPPAL